MTTNNPFAPRENKEHTSKWHLEEIERIGLDEHERRVPNFLGTAKKAGNKAIQIYKEKQLLEAEIRREEREIEGVKAAKEANRIAKEANRISTNAKRISWLALFVSASTVIVMMAIAISEKSA